ncbi:MAG: AMP-binding protein, partial [Demequinaceae bacterium]|nr:AMP-binding protein [Demequinaceae bacterium]
LLTADALRASAAATAAELGGEGNWLLALPTDRIAGAMVVVRAALAGSAVAGVAPGSFTPEAFAAAAERLPDNAPRFVSLVPTQLRRLLASDIGRDALASFDAVLVGGAAVGAETLPGNIVRTYGLTETAGGCVYNGHPIGDTAVRLHADGRVLIATSSLAEEYRPAQPGLWEQWDGRRWLITSDLGKWAADGRLTLTGRIDDVITTGGLKVHPRTVEQAIDALEWVKEVAVVGAANPEWGQTIVAFVVPTERSATQRLWELRAALEHELPKHALPRELIGVEALPRLASGKVNYPLLRTIAADFERNA